MVDTTMAAVAILSPLVSGGAAIVVAALSNSATKKLIEYKLEELTKKVDKHNNVIDRTYALEDRANVFDEKMKVACHRIDDLEKI